jgi:molybdate transport system regulatory protein
MAKNERVPRVYLKIDYGDKIRIGPGKVQLLKLIDEKNSISAAARAMNMSYRRAWLLVEETTQIFGQPVVSTHIGGKGHGGAKLTALGQAIIANYERAVAKAEAAIAEELHALAIGKLARKRKPATAGDTLKFAIRKAD